MENQGASQPHPTSASKRSSEKQSGNVVSQSSGKPNQVRVQVQNFLRDHFNKNNPFSG